MSGLVSERMNRGSCHWSLWMTALLLMVLSGCAAGAGTEATGGASKTSGSNAVVASSASDPSSDIPNDTRCPSGTQIVPETLKAGSTTSPAASWGNGRTGVLLLHQSDGDGMCGWLAHSQAFNDLAHDARFLTFDLCGYGQAQCAGTETNQRQQITAGIDRLQDSGARVIVIVGASLGGYLAVHFGPAAGADSIISLSGYGMAGADSFQHDLKRTNQPVLLTTSHADGETRYQDLQDVAKATGKDFAGFDAGHGYTMLPEAKATVEEWIRDAAAQSSPTAG